MLLVVDAASVFLSETRSVNFHSNRKGYVVIEHFCSAKQSRLCSQGLVIQCDKSAKHSMLFILLALLFYGIQAQILTIKPGKVHGFEYTSKNGDIAEVPKNGFPILVWVHGGGYEIGSASLYGYKGFADIYIPHGIIVVTIQYRVGVYVCLR
ncbi:unnamed protein product [Cylicostephanus goldi]|uniref:Carboxylesterase type B domain-containing protein n=1 Tax=Cylicostephanus goldi TaxID=71465 RepID=A0A3P7PMP9_CYLGO|nr:unnamed protein product [Cylicostephanus goldi]